MANEVEFKLKITTDGKDTFHNLTIDAQTFDDAVKRVTQTAKNASDEIQKMAMQNLNWDMLLNGVEQLNNGIQGLAGSYNSFDKSMRAVNTMAGQDKAGLNVLTDQVKELSKVIPMAREELAGGLYQVISNGVPQDNWISFLEQSSKAAVGGIADLGQTVTVTSTIIKNYGLEWDAAGSIQDKMQRTAKNGVTNFEQLATALPRVSGSASQLGISIDELMAVFATTTGVTGNTAEVSTQLAAVLTSLIKPSSEAAKAAESMGISFNAASVKQVGGLENFLSTLDITITEYAARTGQLKETIYANLFGSAESLRLLTSLTGEQKEKFSQNIKEMADSTGTIEQAFGEMNDSGDATNQKLRNLMASFTDFAGNVVSSSAPFVALAADMSIATSNGIRFYQTMKVMKDSILKCTFVTKTAAATNAFFSSSVAAARRVLYIYQMQVVTARAAIVSTTGAVRLMNIAIASSPYLIAATAAAALAISIYKICQSSDKTEEAQKRLNDTMGEMNTEVAKERISLDALFEPLNRAKAGSEEWQKAKDAILAKYGSYLEKIGVEINSVETARTAYDKLSEAILDTARARAMEKAASGAAESYAGTEGDALKNIRERLYSGIGEGAGKITTAQAGKAWAQIRAAVRSGKDIPQEAREILEQTNTVYYDEYGAYAMSPIAEYIYRQVSEVRQANDTYKKEIADAQAMFGGGKGNLMTDAGSNATGSGSFSTTNVVKVIDMAKMSYTELGTAIENTEKKLKNLAPTETAEANRLSAYNKQLKARKDALDKKYGFGGGGRGGDDNTVVANPESYKELANAIEYYQKQLQNTKPIETQTISLLTEKISKYKEQQQIIADQLAAAARPKELDSLENIDKELAYQKGLRSRCSKENLAGIDAEIERLNSLRTAFEEQSHVVKSLDQIHTYQQLADEVAFYERKIQTATETERVEIKKQINALNELREAWDQQLAQVNRPDDISQLNTIEKLSDAVSYYESVQRTQSVQEIEATQRIINALNEKKAAMERLKSIPQMQADTERLDGLGDTELKLELQLIGMDGIKAKIRELQKMLSDTKNPLDEEQRAEVTKLITSYQEYEKILGKSTLKATEAWGAVKGISNGMQGLTDTLQGNGSAWEKIVSIIDGVIQLYEGFNAIIPIIDMLTGASTKHAAAKGVEAVAETTEAGTNATAAATAVAASAATAAALSVETAAWSALSAAKTFSAHAYIPFAGTAIAAGFIAAQQAIITAAAIPKFANGGIAYGPTFGLFGEYAGASNNPEVVAPLNRLKQLIQPADGIGGGRVEFTIDGRTLKGVLNKVDNFNSRTR